MREDDFRLAVDEALKGKQGVDQAAVTAATEKLGPILAEKTGVQLGNGLWVKGRIDADNKNVVVTMKIPAQRLHWAHAVDCEVVLPSDADDDDAGASQEDDDAAEAAREAGAKSKDSLGAALGKLDHKNDADWTQGGEPLMARVKELSGSTTLTKEELTSMFPDFKRKTE